MIGVATDQPKTAAEAKYSHAVFKTLRDRIIYLDYPPNHVLTEKMLCEEFGVSRTPLREAILKLESLHLVKSIPRYGTLVTQIDVKEIKDAYKVKANLEVMAVSEAIPNLSEEDRAELQEIINELFEVTRRNDVRAMFARDIAFHETIWRVADNAVLVELLEHLHARCLRFCMAVSPDNYFGLDNSMELKAMCDAIVERNAPKARELMRAHNLQFLEMIKEKIFE